MSKLFHIIDDEFAIIRFKGVYRQCKLYHRDSFLYAGWGNGFVGLRRHGTTVPDHALEHVTVFMKVDKMGKLLWAGN